LREVGVTKVRDDQFKGWKIVDLPNLQGVLVK